MKNRNAEAELIAQLLGGYVRPARPVRYVSRPVNVSVGIYLGKLLELVRLLRFNSLAPPKMTL